MRLIVAAWACCGMIGTAAASDGSVLFRVSVKQDGRDIASPSFLARVGEPTTVKMGSDLKLEALAKPREANGEAWTQIRITYFETPDASMVQEMTMRHPDGVRAGSFEYTDPAKRRYVVQVGQ